MAHTISSVHPASTTALGGNMPYHGIEWRSTRKPDYHVYIFNVSARTFSDPLDPDGKRGIMGRIKLLVPGVVEEDPVLPSMKPTEKYHYVTSFPQPIILSKFNDESGMIEQVETDVRRFVVDMICPDNLSITLDAEIRPENAWSVGNDYSNRGVFFSYSNPPAEEDVKKAIAKMERYYKGLLERAATLELTNPAALAQELGSNPDYAFAAEYYGKDVKWNRRQTRQTLCPNCGEQKPSGRKFHMASFGAMCVEPTEEAWRAVVNAGVKTYEQVPEDFRWKKEPKKLSTTELARELERK